MVKTSKPEKVTNQAAAKPAPEPAPPSLPVIDIPRSISVRQLADMLQVDSVLVIKQLMRNGIMANINQIVDYDTAANIVAGFGFKAHFKPLKEQQMATAAEESKKAQTALRQRSR